MVTTCSVFSDAHALSVVRLMTDRGSKSIPTLSPLAMRIKDIALFLCAMA